jgi:glycerol-3-phosphate acyltransferase PlsY
VTTILFLACCVLAYLIGAIPSGLLATRWIAGVDLRRVGSGNTGFTNAARILGWRMALGVLTFDVLKGFLPALLFPGWAGLVPTSSLGAEAGRLLIAVAPVVGHIFSPFLGFRGGKGVATSMGAYLALAPGPLLVALIVGVALILGTRYVSLGSMIGAVVLASVLPFMQPGQPLLASATVLMAVAIVVLHRANIGRLLAGTESRFGERAPAGGRPRQRGG